MIDQSTWTKTTCDLCGGPLANRYPPGTSRHYCKHCTKDCYDKIVEKEKEHMTTTQVRDELDQTPPDADVPDEATNGTVHTEASDDAKSDKPKRERKVRASNKTNGANGTPHEDGAPLSLAESIKNRMGDARKDAVMARSALYTEREKIDKSIRELDEILGEPNGEPVTIRLGVGALSKSPRRAAGASKRKPSGKGRRHRRSPEEIAAGVKAIVALVKKSGSEGMRAEDIKTELKLDAAEMPKLLKTAVEGKQLKSKGRKRATRYYFVK